MSIFKSNSKIIAAFTALFMIASLTFSVNAESDVNTSENQTSVSSSNEEITDNDTANSESSSSEDTKNETDNVSESAAKRTSLVANQRNPPKRAC